MRPSTSRSIRPLVITTLTGLSIGSLLLVGVSPALAAATPVPLGTLVGFAVLGGSTVTNTGPSIINGDIGLAPGSAVTGFPPGVQATGATYVANPIALQAQSDWTTAFTQASGQTPTVPTGSTDLTGLTLTPNLYSTGGVIQLSGNVTLDGTGDPTGVFVFRSLSTLITASASTVTLINVNPCNVFWIVPSSATLGSGSNFVGTVLAGESISAVTGATVTGRLLASVGAVTLDTTTINTPAGCSPLTTNDGTGTTATGASASTAAAQAAAAAAAAQAAAAAEAARVAALRAAELAATGTDAALPAGIAGAIIVAGLVALGVRRRRIGAL